VSRTAAVVLAFAAIVLFALPSSAQLLPNGNVYAGVSYGQFENAGVNRQSYHGWNAAAEAFPFARFTHLSFDLDTSGFYRKGVDGTLTSQYNFLIGPQLSATMGKWRPFVHGMAGLQRVTTSGNIYNPLAIDVGGGTDYKIFFRNFSWRVQGDYVRSRYATANNGAYRVSTGIVWRF
jgi:hypothetical protein